MTSLVAFLAAMFAGCFALAQRDATSRALDRAARDSWKARTIPDLLTLRRTWSILMWCSYMAAFATLLLV